MNERGQALTETLIVSSLALFFSLKLVQLGLHLRHEILFDDLIEQTLICQYQDDPYCITDLRKKLTDLNFKEIQIMDRRGLNHAELKVSVRIDSDTILARQRGLTLDLSTR